MEHMVIKSTTKPMSAFKAAQQRSVVSYHLPSDFLSQHPVRVYIEEARNLLAAHGTTGLRVWDASLHLAYFLSTTGGSLIEKKNILELGAGTGLLSILCAGPLKAHQVIATDGDAEVVENIESNAALNSALLDKGAKTKNLEAKVLDWSDTSALPQILQHEGNELSLDVVLGADITYAVEALEPLVNMLSALNRKCPKVDIIISTVIRNEDTFTAFVNTCARAGFRVSSTFFDCPSLDRQRGFFHKITPPIRIVRLAQNLAASPQQADQTLRGIMNYIS
jgi:protein-lysine N-methyltransferase EEF2KMT